jgi:hypothetical protein
MIAAVDEASLQFDTAYQAMVHKIFDAVLEALPLSTRLSKYLFMKQMTHR